VPWRFSDAGARASRWIIIPASEKPAHKQKSPASLDHLVGNGEQFVRDMKA
jgi:hypothetical protein